MALIFKIPQNSWANASIDTEMTQMRSQKPFMEDGELLRAPKDVGTGICGKIAPLLQGGKKSLVTQLHWRCRGDTKGILTRVSLFKLVLCGSHKGTSSLGQSSKEELTVQWPE